MSIQYVLHVCSAAPQIQFEDRFHFPSRHIQILSGLALVSSTYHNSLACLDTVCPVVLKTPHLTITPINTPLQ